jgi:hypothetical protein
MFTELHSSEVDNNDPTITTTPPPITPGWRLAIFCCFLVTFLVFTGIGITILVIIENNNNDQRLVEDTRCFDGDASTIDYRVGLQGPTLKCTHYTLPDAASCTNEPPSRCFLNGTCLVKGGQITGKCRGECPGIMTSIYSLECPIPIFLTSIQNDINLGLLYFYRPCYLGKCYIYLRYPLGDITELIGSIPGSFNNLAWLDNKAWLDNRWVAYPYDKELEKKCLNLVSDNDPYKYCLRVVIYHTYASTDNSFHFFCEYTYTCAEDRTLLDSENTFIQTIFFGIKKKSNSSKNNNVSTQLNETSTMTNSGVKEKNFSKTVSNRRDISNEEEIEEFVDIIQPKLQNNNPNINWWVNFIIQQQQQQQQQGKEIDSSLIMFQPCYKTIIENIYSDLGINITNLNEKLLSILHNNHSEKLLNDQLCASITDGGIGTCDLLAVFYGYLYFNFSSTNKSGLCLLV